MNAKTKHYLDKEKEKIQEILAFVEKNKIILGTSEYDSFYALLSDLVSLEAKVNDVDYSSEDASCKRCEYNIAIKALKRVLKNNDYCKCCQNREYHRGNYGGYYDCKFDDDDFICVAERDFVINWKAVFEEYSC